MAESDLGPGQATHFMSLMKNENAGPLSEQKNVFFPLVVSFLTYHGIFLPLLFIKRPDARICLLVGSLSLTYTLFAIWDSLGNVSLPVSA